MVAKYEVVNVKSNGDIIEFIKQKNYVMVNNDLGGGSFGKTVLLQDPFIDELFVAKKYEPAYPEIQEKFFKNFLDEIKILHKLNHKNIVRIYNYYAYENIHTGYILMEYIDGERIDKYIREYFAPLEAATLDEVFAQLIEGFQYIEEHGIIHRDIREGNILIDKSGVVKIIDFGIGKINDKPIDCKDSLIDDINRGGSDTLPNEYYQGIYTSKTDMFYLAELLNRLLKEIEDPDLNDFSHQNILDKMMEKNPENRFATFAEIREALNKIDFSNLQISDNDKKTYQNFANALYEALSTFVDERKFNYDTNLFITKLEKALRDNCFEDVIQNNADLISCVVVGAYRYNNRINISRQTVKSFVDWYKSSTTQSQKLILSNIIAKLSIVNVTQQEEELPF